LFDPSDAGGSIAAQWIIRTEDRLDEFASVARDGWQASISALLKTQEVMRLKDSCNLTTEVFK
jgi:hypothetical protein